MRIYMKQQVKQAEQAYHQTGVPFLEMMERAGKGCADAILRHCKPTTATKIVVFCGKGKNGGDGLVIARHLSLAGQTDVMVVLVNGIPADADAYVNLKRLQMETSVSILSMEEQRELVKEAVGQGEVLVDAIFGFGFRGTPDADTRAVITWLNENNGTVVAIDLPSGLECDTGRKTCCVQAEVTLSISVQKPVQILAVSAPFCGAVKQVEIGIPIACFEQQKPEIYWRKEGVFPVFSYDVDSHKGMFGHVLSVCGSYCMPGAGILAAKAAGRSGAGLVRAAFPDKAYPAFSAQLTESLLLPLPSASKGNLSADALPTLLEAVEWADACIIGCGLGRDESTDKVVQTLVEQKQDCPLVLDADGIIAVKNHINKLKERIGAVVYTPHPGELAKMLNMTPAEVQANRLEAADTFIQKYGGVLVLKGSNTIVTDGTTTILNPTGNPGMAKGGSGDLLAGILGAFLAQGIPPLQAAEMAVFLHGAAGDVAAEKRGMIAVTPQDILSALPDVYRQYLKTKTC